MRIPFQVTTKGVKDTDKAGSKTLGFTGTGHANHKQWQGKVYYIKPIKDYSAVAKRIGQSKIEDLWEATGYSADGSHESDPLGLKGYNCRHRHYMISEGTFDPAKHPDDPEPNPVTLNGKTYDYYAITQKMRAKEREIRGLKREREALKALGLDEDTISKGLDMHHAEFDPVSRELETAKADLKTAKENAETTAEALKKFDGVDPDKLKQQIEDLQADIKKCDADHASGKAGLLADRAQHRRSGQVGTDQAQ